MYITLVSFVWSESQPTRGEAAREVTAAQVQVPYFSGYYKYLKIQRKNQQKQACEQAQSAAKLEQL